MHLRARGWPPIRDPRFEIVRVGCFVPDPFRRLRTQFTLRIEVNRYNRDAGGQIVVEGIQRGLIEPANQVERFFTLFDRDSLRECEIPHRSFPRPEHRRLIHRREKPVGVHRLARFESTVRIGHDHISGE